MKCNDIKNPEIFAVINYASVKLLLDLQVLSLIILNTILFSGSTKISNTRYVSVTVYIDIIKSFDV